MDTRDTPEQAELRRSARQLARELGPATVADLDDAARRKRLGAAVRDAGWLELRDGDDAGALATGALASGVEVAIVADALGGAVADVGFAGPVLAGDLARRAGVRETGGAVVALSPALVEPAIVSTGPTSTPLYAVDADDDVGDAYVFVPEGAGYRLARLRLDAAAVSVGSDLTRAVRVIPPGATPQVIAGQGRLLTGDDLAEWSALGLALTSADLVGGMRGVLDITVAYAAERKQYGVPVGSFQAVQHLLAEARCLMEGSQSVALHASWAVDNLAPAAARTAGRVAKTYCARAARVVCETAVQVHGGIGNTWECMAHVYLRRTLLSSQWFGDDGVQLLALGRERFGPQGVGVAHGLS